MHRTTAHIACKGLQILLALLILSGGLLTLSNAFAADIDLDLESHTIAFDYSSPVQSIPYQALKTPAGQPQGKRSVCVIIPHMKDEYWISVYHGFKQKADQLGLAFQWHEAGGYLELERQIRQIGDCIKAKHDALIIGAVSSDAPALLAAIKQASARVPVLALVNELKSPDLTAKVGVSWERMGEILGRQIVKDLPKDSAEPYFVSMVSGPSESGWAPILEQGLRTGLSSTRIRFDQNLQSDSDYHNQFLQVEKAIANCGPNHILIGSAPAAEAAMSLVKLMNCPNKPKIYATYYSHAVKRGLRSGTISGAVVDFPVLQGWLAAEQIARVLEGAQIWQQIGPPIKLALPQTLPPNRWALIEK